jgi:sarcosine/dimethylglycine N-methyltransferase
MIAALRQRAAGLVWRDRAQSAGAPSGRASLVTIRKRIAMSHPPADAIAFYNRHPISAAIVLAKLRAVHGNLAGLRPTDLFAHDQDHFGGLAANDTLAERALIGPGTRVVDFCAGLGGPARYFAHRYGADVVGIELTPSRVAGAAELTRLVGLQDRVRVLLGDITRVPLADVSMDAVVSQEALLHVPDKHAALAEALRVLRPGGRLAFTDIVASSPLDPTDAALMWEGMAWQPLLSHTDYRMLLEHIGFTVESIEDLTEAWGPILQDRLTMYQRLRAEATAAGTPPGDDAFHRAYMRFIPLVLAGRVGGVRATAVRR